MLSDEKRLNLFKWLLLARRFDERVCQEYKEKGIPELPHSHIGQEAVCVGTMSAIQADDYVVPSLRSRPAYLYRCGIKDIIAGMWGRDNSPVRGRVTAHHMGDKKRNILSTTGIVGGQFATAAGAALSCRLESRGKVAVCFFGDGAVNRGDFHEAINLAAVWKAPLILVCENNQIAMSQSITKNQLVLTIAERACGYGIRSERVNGNDVEQVYKAASAAVSRARSGLGPELIDAVCFRQRGHAEAFRDDRTEDEFEFARLFDPVDIMKRKLEKENILNTTLLAEMENAIESELNEAIAEADSSQMTIDPTEMYSYVYPQQKGLGI